MSELCSYVRPSRSRGYTVVGVTDGESISAFTVPDGLIGSLGISVDSEIAHDALFQLRAEDELYRAELCALRILSFGDNNQRSLYNKLTAKGFSTDAASSVCDKMVRLGYVNEAEQLERLIMREARTCLSGPRKIRAKLRARGYSASDISRVMAALIADGQLDFEKNKEALFEKKLARDASDEEKLKLLFKNGY